MKKCCKCGLEKPLEEFYKGYKNSDGKTFKCKACFKQYHKEKYQKRPKKIHAPEEIELKNKITKEKRILYDKEYYKRTHYQKKYKEEHREEINQKQKERYYIDPNTKLKQNVSNRVRAALKIQNIRKDNRTHEIISCEIEGYKKYLEALWNYPEWNWPNHGELWEIDHIIPLSSFNLNDPEERKKAFHYTNTLPVWKTTQIAESFGYKDVIGNRNKSNKLI